MLAKKGMKSLLKLNKYGVDPEVLEGLGAEALRKALKSKELIVIDEIGSMEIMSGVFREALMECLNSDKKVLATVRYNAQPFTDEIKKMGNTSLFTLSRENYLEVKKKVKGWIGV